MRILCGKLKKIINNFQNDFLKKKLHLPTPANLNTINIRPVKLAFKTFESKTTDPNANPLIILHGFLGLKRNLKGTSIELESKTKRKVYALDLRNHGYSPHVPEHNLECMTDDIAYMMQKERLKKISILGFSMGGRILMNASFKYPELVEKVIIVDVSPISAPQDSLTFKDIILTILNMNISPELSLADARAVVRLRLLETVKDQNENFDIILLNLKKLPSGDPVDWPKIKELFPNAELEWLDT